MHLASYSKDNYHWTENPEPEYLTKFSVLDYLDKFPFIHSILNLSSVSQLSLLIHDKSTSLCLNSYPRSGDNRTSTVFYYRVDLLVADVHITVRNVLQMTSQQKVYLFETLTSKNNETDTFKYF